MFGGYPHVSGENSESVRRNWVCFQDHLSVFFVGSRKCVSECVLGSA